MAQPVRVFGSSVRESESRTVEKKVIVQKEVIVVHREVDDENNRGRSRGHRKHKHKNED